MRRQPNIVVGSIIYIVYIGLLVLLFGVDSILAQMLIGGWVVIFVLWLLRRLLYGR